MTWICRPPTLSDSKGAAVILDNNHIITSCGNKVFNPLRQAEGFYNTRIKHFGRFTVTTCFSRSVLNPQKLEKHSQSKVVFNKKSTKRYDPFTDSMIEICKDSNIDEPELSDEALPKKDRSDSIKRAKDSVIEIAYANRFQYFVTLTLDQSKISRTDTNEIRSKLNRWLSNQVQRNQMKYVILPEYHKQKAWEDKPAVHFHGLISGVFRMSDSGKTTQRGQTILNMENWHYGFTTAIELDNEYDKIVNYVLKYITKDSQKILGRWYLSGGKGLERKVPTEYINTNYDTFEGTEYMVPEANMAVKYKTVVEDT